MNKKKLIELRCKAWGITEDEYYCNQCSDFSLEDMARAYRRGKNKGRADHAKENVELREELRKTFSDWLEACNKYGEVNLKFTKAKEIIRDLLNSCFGYSSKTVNYEVKAKAEAFLKE